MELHLKYRYKKFGSKRWKIFSRSLRFYETKKKFKIMKLESINTIKELIEEKKL